MSLVAFVVSELDNPSGGLSGSGVSPLDYQVHMSISCLCRWWAACKPLLYAPLILLVISHLLS